MYAGAGLANVLRSINDFSPLIFAIVIPLAYPFMVPLGLHWPLNAIMLLNIQTLGYDFIQGPMGAWNFSCVGANRRVCSSCPSGRRTRTCGKRRRALLRLRTPQQAAEFAAAHVPVADLETAPAKASAATVVAAVLTRDAVVPGMLTEIASPLDGTIVPLAEVPDPVFSRGTMGPGVAVMP